MFCNGEILIFCLKHVKIFFASEIKWDCFDKMKKILKGWIPHANRVQDDLA